MPHRHRLAINLKNGYDAIVEGHFGDASKHSYKIAQLQIPSDATKVIDPSGVYLLQGRLEEGKVVNTGLEGKVPKEITLNHGFKGLAYCPGEVFPTYHHGRLNGRLTVPRTIFLKSGTFYIRSPFISNKVYRAELDSEVAPMVNWLFEAEKLMADPEHRELVLEAFKETEQRLGKK